MANGIKTSELPTMTDALEAADRIVVLDDSDANLSSKLKARSYQSVLSDIDTDLQASVVQPAEAARDEAVAARDTALASINNRGDYAAGTYNDGDFVRYQDAGWFCVTDGTTTAPQTSDPDWVKAYEDGQDGAPGTAATVSVGTVTQGGSAQVTNSGTSEAAVFDFVLPEGPVGDEPDHEWNGTELRFKNPDGSWGTYTDLKGDPGDGAGDMLKSTYDTGDNGKVDVAELAESVAWGDVTSKPSTFTPSAHTHAWGDLTSPPDTATRWPAWSEVTSKPSTFTPSSHTHPATDITVSLTGLDFITGTDVQAAFDDVDTKLDGLGTMADRDVTISTSDPNDGDGKPDGAIWLKYSS